MEEKRRLENQKGMSTERLGEEGVKKAESLVEKAREAIDQKSPEEIRREAKNIAAKATAGVTGAMEGFAEQAEPAKEAVQQAGETLKEGLQEGKHQIDKAKREMQSSGSGTQGRSQ